jgi:hypothetical protein
MKLRVVIIQVLKNGFDIRVQATDSADITKLLRWMKMWAEWSVAEIRTAVIKMMFSDKSE